MMLSIGSMLGKERRTANEMIIKSDNNTILTQLMILCNSIKHYVINA